MEQILAPPADPRGEAIERILNTPLGRIASEQADAVEAVLASLPSGDDIPAENTVPITTFSSSI